MMNKVQKTCLYCGAFINSVSTAFMDITQNLYCNHMKCKKKNRKEFPNQGATNGQKREKS